MNDNVKILNNNSISNKTEIITKNNDFTTNKQSKLKEKNLTIKKQISVDSNSNSNNSNKINIIYKSDSVKSNEVNRNDFKNSNNNNNIKSKSIFKKNSNPLSNNNKKFVKKNIVNNSNNSSSSNKNNNSRDENNTIYKYIVAKTKNIPVNQPYLKRNDKPNNRSIIKPNNNINGIPLTSSSISTSSTSPSAVNTTLTKKKKNFMRDIPKKRKPSALKRNILLYKQLKEKYISNRIQHIQQQEEIENEEKQLILQNENQVELETDFDKITTTTTTTTATTTQCLLPSSPAPIQSDVDLLSEKVKEILIKEKSNSDETIHDYMNQTITDEIDGTAREFIKKIKQFQDNYALKNPDKPKKRFITGLREIERAADCGKLSAVIIAPNIEDINCPGGLNDSIKSIIRLCRSKQILYTFALSRRAIGRLINVQIKISAFGILFHDGAEDIYSKLSKLTMNARESHRIQQKLQLQQIEDKSNDSEIKDSIELLDKIDLVNGKKEILNMFVKHTQEKKQNHKVLLQHQKEQKQARVELEQKEMEKKKQQFRQHQKQQSDIKRQQEKEKERDKLKKELQQEKPTKQPQQQQQSKKQNQASTPKEKTDVADQLLYNNSDPNEHQQPKQSLSNTKNNNKNNKNKK